MTVTPDDARSRVAHALRTLARRPEVAEYVREHPPLRTALSRVASRYLAGDRAEDALRVARTANEHGVAASIDLVGEDSGSIGVAREVTELLIDLAKSIADWSIDASISVDLSHIGLVQGREVALSQATRLVAAAAEGEVEVMMLAESSLRTDDVLAVWHCLARHNGNVGITLQASLRRTPDDLTEALGLSGKIRLVKGAYLEPPSIAYARGDELDRAYIELAQTLVESGHPCSMATHDSAILARLVDLVNRKSSDPEIEFEMLYGVTPHRLRDLARRGLRTRVYLPYGRDWFLYLCHRLAEHPPALYDALADAVLGSRGDRPGGHRW